MSEFNSKLDRLTYVFTVVIMTDFADCREHHDMPKVRGLAGLADDGWKLINRLVLDRADTSMSFRELLPRPPGSDWSRHTKRCSLVSVLISMHANVAMMRVEGQL